LNHANIFKNSPIGKPFSVLTKLYIGALTEKLKHLDIERYYYIVFCIDEYPGNITQQELSNITGIDKVSMVRIIDYLSKKGYVNRQQNSNDRREYFIELTAKSRKALPDIRNAFQELNKVALKGIAKEQIECFGMCLDTIQQNLESLPVTSVKIDYKRTKKS